MAKPTIQEATGVVIIAWASLEFAMTMILAELLETDSGTAMVASAALDYRHRRDLIVSLARGKLRGAATEPRLNAFLGNVKGMNKMRNQVAHSLILETKTAGKFMHWSMRNQGAYQSSMRSVRADQVLNSGVKIAALANEGMEIAAVIGADVRTWRESNPPIAVVHRMNEGRHPATNFHKS